MSTLTITINLDNAAFIDVEGEPYVGPEVARILLTLAAKVADAETPYHLDAFLIRDVNGNTVGRTEVSA